MWIGDRAQSTLIYIYNHLQDQNNDNSIFDYYNGEIIESYRILELHNKENIYNKVFKEIISLYNINENYNDSNIFFRQKRLIELESLYWAKDLLYFSIYPNPAIYNLFDNLSLLSTISINKINLFIKSKFVKVSDFDQFIKDRHISNLMSGNDVIDIIKYHYINGLYDDEKEIIYTIPCFRVINDLYCHYCEDYSTSINDDNVIYIDPYNLKYLYNKYLNDLIINDNTKDFYYKFLNLSHIILYYKKLYKYENFNNKDEDNISNTIYIKFVSFDNYIIDRQSESNYKNKINIKNIYIPIKDFGIDTLNDILKYIDYNKNGYFFFTNLYFTNIVNDSSISDNIKEKINQYPIYNFDICFKKPAVKLNKDLYSLIMSLDFSFNKYKDLYLYHIEDPKNINYALNYQTYELESDNYDWSISINDFIKMNLQKNLKGPSEDNIQNICLEPYFNDVYEEEQQNTKIYSDYFLNNILEIKLNSDNSYYRFKSNNINTLFIYNINSQEENQENNQVNNINNIEDRFFDNLTIENKFISNENTSYNINIQNIDGINYGYYLISTYFDNTCHTLDIKNDMYKTINSIDYIEKYSVEDISNNTSYLYDIYENTLPYIKNSNIVSFTLDNINTIIIPNNYKLTNNYRQNKFNNDLTLYYYDKKINNIELIRYFDHITPYIYKTNKVYTYNLYYKNTEELIENDLYIKKNINSYIYTEYPNSSFIYSFDGISYFNYDKLNNNSEFIDKYKPMEYKYFNDNVFYNLPNNFILDVKDLDNKDMIFNSEIDLINYEIKENSFNLFKEYITSINTDLKSESNSRILFLYNKYNVVYSSIKFVNNKGEYNYTLRIKYTLL